MSALCVGICVFKNESHGSLEKQRRSINVFNWGEFMSNGSDGLLNVNQEFERLTGIHVNYTTFSSNEEMYAKIKSGSVLYDVVIPSDYMIAKMVSEGLLAKLNFDNIPNVKNIMPNLKGMVYDPQGEYSVPYAWGVVGVVYNSQQINKPVGGFDALWDEELSGDILMFLNSRDAFSVALKKLGFSFNTDDKNEILLAAKELRRQKKLVQAYVMDEIFDKMQSAEALIAPYYSGDALVMMRDNQNLRFVFPKGTNRFIDAACVLETSEKKEVAEQYINFLCEPRVALANALSGGYSTPNQQAFEMLPAEIRNSQIAYPSDDMLQTTECYCFKPAEIGELMDALWIEIMVADEDNSIWVMPVFIVVCITTTISIGIARMRGRKQRR
ncbi:MAG: spermidine/putrescine ABC transporter substrate-binding protein [Oscillospiraceae bacterium]|nr:spermidine/putrescine ABC transporter substrate-binding protein [Oscillospiraceae bacterium]